jgi:predicted ATP-grasp superfamily ATP-dependent carboligase
MMNALVANAKSACSLAVIRSLGEKGIDITGASDRSSDFPLFSKYCRRRILLKTNPADIDARLDELLEIIKNNSFDAFLPVMSEGLLLALAKRKNDFEQFTRLVLPSFEHFNILTSKEKISQMLRELDIQGPKTFFPEYPWSFDTIQQESEFPLIIKPYFGEGAAGLRVANGRDELINYYYDIKARYGSAMVQEYIHGTKYTAVFLLNRNSEARRFFVHRVIREYPLSGGPACCMESVEYPVFYEIGMRLLSSINYSGMAEMEFIVDNKDGKPKIIDVNPRFYGSVQCAVSSGADFPFAFFRMAVYGDIEPDLSYRKGVVGRHLLFEDTKHLMSVLRGEKSPKYNLGKMATLISYLNFFRDDCYFVLSLSDLYPAFRKIFSRFQGI